LRNCIEMDMFFFGGNELCRFRRLFWLIDHLGFC
jgi:hypothetical protein